MSALQLETKIKEKKIPKEKKPRKKVVATDAMKASNRIYNRGYYNIPENREKQVERSRAYRDKNRDAINVRRRRNLALKNFELHLKKIWMIRGLLKV
jgi:hypothetical protein